MRMESNKNNNAPKKKNKFNIYWIYGIFILVILAVQIFGYGMGSNQEIDYKKFIQLAEDNSIEILVFVNQAEVSVYINESDLSRDEFNDISRDAFSLHQPHYTFHIGTVDALQGRLKDLHEARAQEEKLYPTYRSE